MNEKKKDTEDKIVLLSHGAGGALQEKLIRFITKSAKLRKIGNGIGLDAYDDGATIPLTEKDSEIVITSDGHTIDPIFFPGGNLGELAATGTINDLLMMGAKPIAISSTIFIEEGFSFDQLEKITTSFHETLKDNNVALLCGDTKVLPKGNLDKIIMSTTGIGLKKDTLKILDSNIKIGDKIIITGYIGDHGSSLIANRKEINIDTTLLSDLHVLSPIIKSIPNLQDINAMKDPTRGGVSAALNNWAQKSNVSIFLYEEKLPIRKEVKAICEILGLNPLDISNEGKALISVDRDHADQVLNAIRSTELGQFAEIIGEVREENQGKVLMKTKFGGTRFINMPMGEPIPRVC
ncbi:MAG: hydrogenase expression/formation protein HypE [Candidatus Lokiarchaeota archaeon]|nr:hydrogenase expression/formation protein HypE [Candidatus Lokiarchaeota archaeon]